jgi:hypothetical protein
MGMDLPQKVLMTAPGLLLLREPPRFSSPFQRLASVATQATMTRSLRLLPAKASRATFHLIFQGVRSRSSRRRLPGYALSPHKCLNKIAMLRHVPCF